MRRRAFIGAFGAAAALGPVGVLAQQPGKVYRIAGVHPSSPSPWFMNEARNPKYWGPFFGELRQLGFVEGRNLEVERHFGNGQSDRFAELASRVAASAPDVILCLTDRLAAHMKEATATIPIVAVASDPVAFGIVPSLVRPGGNLTGVAPDGGLTFYAKHLELLREVVPSASRVAYLTPREVWESPILLARVKEAATQVGVVLVPVLLDSPIQEPEYRRAFSTIERARADAMIIGDSSENWANGSLIIELATAARLPTICPGSYFAERGGLISYGADYPELYRHAGAQIGRALQGADPGDIPVYQARQFELVVNVKTAKALGLAIPQSLLLRADRVID